MLYPILAGLAGAACSTYFPILRIDPQAPLIIKSFGRLINASVAYLLAARVAEFALQVIGSITPLTSQHAHVFFFLVSIWFVYSLPQLENFIKHYFSSGGGSPL